MKKVKKLSDIYLNTFIKVTIPLFLILLIIWICNDIFVEYSNSVKRLEKFIIEEKKSILKENVNNIITYIDYRYNEVESQLKSVIKDESNNAFNIVNDLYNKYIELVGYDKTVKIIKDTLRAMRYHNGKGYFFILDINGVEQVNGDRPEIEGKNLLNLKDEKGNFVAKNMIKVIKSDGEGFYSYYWSKPHSKAKQLSHKKISYIKYFKPLNWIVGTGLYFKDMENEVKESVKKYIKKFRFGKNHKCKIFIIQPIRKDNKIVAIKDILYNKSEVSLSKIIPVDKYSTNMPLKKIEQSCFNSKEGSFATCHSNNQNSGNKFIRKLTFSKYYPRWNWGIVAGMPLSEIDTIIRSKKQQLIKTLIIKILLGFIPILIAILFAIKIFKRTGDRVKNDFKKLISQLQNKFAIKEIDTDKIEIEELAEITKVINLLIKSIEENNKILTAYFNKEHIANFIVNQEGYFENVNKAFEKITGYTNEEAKKLKFYEFIYDEDKDTAINKGIKRLQGETSLEPFYECRIVTKDGKIKWVLLINNHIFLETRNKNIILGTALDITNYKTLTDKLTQQCNLFKTLLDSLNVPVWIFDVEKNKYKLANKAFYEYYGIKESVIGKDFKAFFPEDVCKKANKYNFEVLKTGKPQKYETIITIKNEKRTFIVNKSPLFDSENKITGIVCSGIDITDKLNIEKEKAKNRNLESLGMLAGGIAHDFNNILTSILGNISLLEIYIQNEKAKKFLKRLEEAVNRAEKLSKKLLTFSKGSHLVKKATNINDILKNIAEFIFAGTSVETVYTLDKNIPDILLDKEQISEVFHNILINAREAIEANNGKFIYLKTEITKLDSDVSKLKGVAEGEYVKISIQDTGYGIDEDILPQIFDPYFTTKETGSGLGLATSYLIVKEHNGLINVLSEPGAGTIFEIYLPLIKSSDKNKENKTTTKETYEKSLNILILEDEEEIRKLLEEVLALLGHKPDFAVKGEEAVEIFAKKNYDLVICDMTIKGGMGGIETIKMLKDINPDVYAIVSTGYSDSDVVKNYDKYGFKGVLLKPYTIKKLKEIIDNFQIKSL